MCLGWGWGSGGVVHYGGEVAAVLEDCGGGVVVVGVFAVAGIDVVLEIGSE